MDQTWLWHCEGVVIRERGQPVINGSVGVTAGRELVLMADDGAVVDRAPVAEVSAKIHTFWLGTGDTVEMNGHRYLLAGAA
jgi:hypothetical protein